MAKYFRFSMAFLLFSSLFAISFSAQSLFETFFGPEIFVQGIGDPVEEIREFSATGFQGPFILHLRNGDDLGNNRITSAKVWLNDKLIFSPEHFSQKARGSDIPVVLQDENILKVLMQTKPGGFSQIWIEGLPITIDELLSQVDESEILLTATDLQDFGTRQLDYQGNVDAAVYIHDRFAAIPGLSVAYQGGDLRNVVATLPGTDEASDKVFIVGAHYDSVSSTPGVAPGATDNACGVGIVLELARIMSKYRFKNDLKFAAWNGEEYGLVGSREYVLEAELNHENIQLYLNYDSSAYDPYGRLVLDIIFNELSSGIAQRMEQLNSSYGLGFTIVHNVHTSCSSDHRTFMGRGYCSVTTHTEEHGPAHTANDTVDKISMMYATKNCQMGMAVLAELAVFADIPVNEYSYYVFDGHDFNGSGSSDVSVWRPSNGRWYIKGMGSYGWGISGDIPVNGDYNGDGTTDIAVWRPSNGRWYLRGLAGSTWGTAGDIPIPGNYDGDINNTTDIAVWRSSNGRWYIKGISIYTWGTSGDVPVPGDYNGDGTTDVAVWRPSNGRWYIRGVGGYIWGTSGDIPVPADYNGDGVTDIAVWRPSNGRWYIKGFSNLVWGTTGDIPAPADYNGDGTTDIAVWRPSTGRWFIKDIGGYLWGMLGDVPLLR